MLIACFTKLIYMDPCFNFGTIANPEKPGTFLLMKGDTALGWFQNQSSSFECLIELLGDGTINADEASYIFKLIADDEQIPVVPLGIEFSVATQLAFSGYADEMATFAKTVIASYECYGHHRKPGDVFTTPLYPALGQLVIQPLTLKTTEDSFVLSYKVVSFANAEEGVMLLDENIELGLIPLEERQHIIDRIQALITNMSTLN